MPQHLSASTIVVRDYRTDDFPRDHAAMKSRGVRFVEEPRDEACGRVAVFEGLYGNRWDFIGRVGSRPQAS